VHCVKVVEDVVVKKVHVRSHLLMSFFLRYASGETDPQAYSGDYRNASLLPGANYNYKEATIARFARGVRLSNAVHASQSPQSTPLPCSRGPSQLGTSH